MCKTVTYEGRSDSETGGGGYQVGVPPTILQGIPWWAYNPWDTGILPAPGWSLSRSWMYRLVSTAAWVRGCTGERPCGSVPWFTVGKEPLRVLGSSFLLTLVWDVCADPSGVHGRTMQRSGSDRVTPPILPLVRPCCA